MALPVVLIDVPPEAPAPLVDVLVRACSHGLRRGECDTAAPSVGQVVATVTVSWSDPSHSCIILSVTSSQRAPEADRRSRICFGPADAPAERWRASGFAAATLAEPMVSAALVEPSAPRQPPTVPPPPEPPPPPDRWGSWLGLAVLAGPGFDDGVWRFGSRLRLSQTLAEGPLLATAGLHWTERGRQEPVAARWDLAQRARSIPSRSASRWSF
jgi:hypothetical protein